jgi:hypothetical protein
LAAWIVLTNRQLNNSDRISTLRNIGFLLELPASGQNRPVVLPDAFFIFDHIMPGSPAL